jgi:hypothetical protein
MQSQKPLHMASSLDLDDSQEMRLTNQFLEGLRETIRGKPNYVRLMTAFGRDEAAIDRMFAEQISELELAACFPMRWQELRVFLTVCTPDKEA